MYSRAVIREYAAKINEMVLEKLVRGDMIKVNKSDGSEYFLYSGDSEKVYVVNNNLKEYFSYPDEDTGVETVSFVDACGESLSEKISESQWIYQTEGPDISLADYNRKILQILLPGDIYTFQSQYFDFLCLNGHYILYIGNGQVLHLNHTKHPTYEYREKHKAEYKTFPQTGSIITHDNFLELNYKTKGWKKINRNKLELPVNKILERAESQSGPTRYSWWTQNCKHFVKEMKYGTQYRFTTRSFAIGRPTDILCS